MQHTHVILRSDVDNLGRLGDHVRVKPGYARNYLIPQGLAMPLTEANKKQFALEHKKLGAKMEAIRSEARGLAEKIAAASLSIEVRVGEGDKLYGSVTGLMIAQALKDQHGIEIDRRLIVLDQPIRSLGEHAVVVKLHPDVHPELKVQVVKQGGGEEAAAKAPAEEAVSAEPAQTEAE
jgi:large subunit ribosomal protein L9